MLLRNAVRKPLEEKNKSFQEVLYATKPDSQERLQNLKEIELEMQAVLSETKKRYFTEDINYSHLYIFIYCCFSLLFIGEWEAFTLI